MPKNNVYIAANATGLGDYPLNNGFQSFAGGAAYVTELKRRRDRTCSFGSFYGGDQNVYPTGLALDPAGNIYLAGYTTGEFRLSMRIRAPIPEGSTKAFVAKISAPKAVGAATFVDAASSQLGAVAAGSIVTAYGVDLATGTASAAPTALTLAGPAPISSVPPASVRRLRCTSFLRVR